MSLAAVVAKKPGLSHIGSGSTESVEATEVLLH